MKRSGKIAGRVISILLLLVFSVTITPLDFLHRHTPEPVCSVSPEGGSTCRHKQHLTQKSSFCLLCAVHHVQLITPATAGQATYLPVSRFAFPDFHTGSAFVSIPRSFLRGPPENRVVIS